MKISLNWIKDWVDLPWNAEEIAEKLSELGFPVEGRSTAGVSVRNVVVAKILQIDKHPNADKLQVTRINDGQGERTVVCGAKNIAVGQIVPLAKPGAKLPGGIEISVSAIRGVQSEGMLCSERELGISNEHAGILQLPTDAPLGQEVADFFGGSDTIYDIDVAPNRGDALSHVGIARELAALAGVPLKKYDAVWVEGNSGTTVPVQIDEPTLCRRYIARTISGVKVAPSPDWMARRLQACGIRPINNIVDITNYVLLEWGHPLHAFDLAKLQGPRIVVRRAGEKEKFLALDEKTYELNGNDLVIADAKSAVAIAGVMGGQLSGVSDSTKDILLESAVFDRVSVRKTSRRLALMSESSMRFEKGTNLWSAEQASNRAAQLILELAGGKPGTSTDAGEKTISRTSLTLDLKKLDRVAGFSIPKEQTLRILSGINFEPKESSGKIKLSVPPYRLDVQEEADVIEEVIRFTGYNSVPTVVSELSVDESEPSAQHAVDRRVSIYLRGLGITETMTASFCSEASAISFGAQKENLVEIANPLSQEETVLRPSLLPNLLKAVQFNAHHQRQKVWMFELGKRHSKDQKENAPKEFPAVGIVLYGNAEEKSWRSKGREVDFYSIKGVIEAMRDQLHLSNVQFLYKAKHPFLHPHQSLEILVRGKSAGFAGMLHPAAARALDLKMPCAVLELDIPHAIFGRPSLQPFSRYPMVERDIAIVVDQATTWEKILKEVSSAGGSLLKNAQPFDVFEGEALGKGKKSVAFRCQLQADDKTLSDAEINSTVERIRTALKERAGAQLR